MRVFVFEYVEGLTDNYHSGGGAVVVAENLSEALAMLPNHGRRGAEPMPDAEYWIDGGAAARVFVFPDSGCC